MPRIPQEPILDSDKTTPNLANLRKSIENLVPSAEEITLEKFNKWLQAPVNAGKQDSLCLIRAQDLGEILAPNKKPYKPSALDTTKPTPMADKWKAIDNNLTKGTPVLISGLDTFIGGEMSKFTSGKSHHVVLFLAFGTDSKGKDFYVGLDPDTNATAETQALWKKLVPDNKIKDLPSASLHKILKDMMLGTTGKGFGPILRKYYVDKTEPFPKIQRL